MAKYDWGYQQMEPHRAELLQGPRLCGPREKVLKPGGTVVLEAFHIDATEKLQVVGSDYRVVFNANGLKKLYGEVGLKIMRYEEPVGTADFTRQQLRLVKMVAQKL